MTETENPNAHLLKVYAHEECFECGHFGKYAHGFIWAQTSYETAVLLSFNSYFGSLQLAFVNWYCLQTQGEAPRYGKPKLASHSTSSLSRSRQISIKRSKIKSRSTDFLSRSRHNIKQAQQLKWSYHIQQISLQGQEMFESSSRMKLSHTFNGRIISVSGFVPDRHQINWHILTVWTKEFKPIYILWRIIIPE